MTVIGSGTSAFFNRSRLEMNNLRRAAESMQSQLSRGERLGASSDDPVSASRLRVLARAERLSQSNSANAARATSDLTLAADAMAEMADTMGRIRQLAIAAANDVTSGQAHEAIAVEMSALRQRLVVAVNAKDSAGHALFGGETSGPAYTLDGAGNAVYAGTANSTDLDLGEGQTVARSMTGPEFIQFTSGGIPVDLLAMTKNLADAIGGGSATPAADALAALEGLDDGLQSLTKAQTVLGSRLAWIEIVEDRRVQTSEYRAAEQIEAGGIEMADAIAELQQMLVVLEASQASFARLGQLSLFNAI